VSRRARPKYATPAHDIYRVRAGNGARRWHVYERASGTLVADFPTLEAVSRWAA
jgi:hypothetical protein